MMTMPSVMGSIPRLEGIESGILSRVVF
jgi:hypothetical protein